MTFQPTSYHEHIDQTDCEYAEETAVLAVQWRKQTATSCTINQNKSIVHAQRQSSLSALSKHKSSDVVRRTTTAKKTITDPATQQHPAKMQEYDSQRAKRNGHYEGRTRDLGVISTTL
jgi:hypothetical protein